MTALPATPEPCHQAPGHLTPVINRNRCEGKGACVAACPRSVLAMGTLSREEVAALSLIGKLKAWVHGSRQARVARPEACEGCAACVAVCPESAIKLALRVRNSG